MVSSTVALGLTVATLVAFTGVGVWFSRGRVGSVEDLISARDSAGSRRTTATLVASVMGVWVLFSAPEAGASFGIAAVVGYAVGEAVPMLVYARLGPRIRELIPEGHSLTEYAHARYGTAMYAFVLLVSALYMFIFLALAFAILGAELINQTWWQRIYAADSSETVGRSFRTAALANGAIVFVTAFFGVVAVGNAAVVTDPASAGYNADAAFFVLLGEAFPEWLVLAAVLLALLLVMSSIDTLFNALSSLVTADLARLLAEPSDRHLALGSRALTVVVAAAAIYVSLRAQSVLRLFFFADLLGAAVAFPLVYGLYSTRITGLGALASSLTGLAVGLAFFPDLRGVITSIPVVGGLLPAADPLYLTSFGGAFVVSTAASLVAARLADAGFDLGRLSREIRRFDDGQTDAPSSD